MSSMPPHATKHLLLESEQLEACRRLSQSILALSPPALWHTRGKGEEGVAMRSYHADRVRWLFCLGSLSYVVDAVPVGRAV